ncbi:MAG: phosphotransferase [Bryobacteraceae bacterium]
MTAGELLVSLAGPREAFETSLARVHSVDSGRELITEFLRMLDRDELLDNSERERRLAAVFRRVSLNSADTSAVAKEGATVQRPVLRNRLAQLLPAEQRVLLYRPVPEDAVGQEVPSLIVGRRALEGKLTADAPTPSGGGSGLADVLLLSVVEDPASQHLLSNAQFLPLRYQSVQELDRMLETNAEICAFLVDSSFLSLMDRDEQINLIKKLARFSTFVWLRFNEKNLLPTNLDVGECVRTARCKTGLPDYLELSIRPDSVLQEREIENLRAARGRLTDGHASGLFTPGELDSSEIDLLGAAMSQYSKKRRFTPRAQLTRVTTRFLRGGRSGARVALVRVNDLRVPVIAKLDQKDLILDEARRFLTFIHKDNPELNPEVHFHGRAALILFGVIPGTQTADEPAPTLEQRLSDYWFEEMGDPKGASDETTLLTAFSDVLRRLIRLNTQKCTDSSFECKANPYLDCLLNMEGQGFDWGFDAERKVLRKAAQQLFATAQIAAVCHGDAHTGNILIRGSEGSLIDYACSGPGHPCSDLVRLELSIYSSSFVQFGSETQLSRLQSDLTTKRLSFDDLFAQYGDLLRSKTARLVLRMCVAARDGVGEVLKAHDLSWDHYVATKVLSAWQALQVPSLQQALVRSVIVANQSLG